jgi:hypothetical protein
LLKFNSWLLKDFVVDDRSKFSPLLLAEALLTKVALRPGARAGAAKPGAGSTSERIISMCTQASIRNFANTRNCTHVRNFANTRNCTHARNIMLSIVGATPCVARSESEPLICNVSPLTGAEQRLLLLIFNTILPVL